jgi:hypothetical protein
MIGPELFVADSWAVVCRDCGIENDVQLVWVLECYWRVLELYWDDRLPEMNEPMLPSKRGGLLFPEHAAAVRPNFDAYIGEITDTPKRLELVRDGQPDAI